VWHPEYGVKSVPVELLRADEILAVNIELKER
jgi:hypothetical protein